MMQLKVNVCNNVFYIDSNLQSYCTVAFPLSCRTNLHKLITLCIFSSLTVFIGGLHACLSSKERIACSLFWFVHKKKKKDKITGVPVILCLKSDTEFSLSKFPCTCAEFCGKLRHDRLVRANSFRLLWLLLWLLVTPITNLKVNARNKSKQTNTPLHSLFDIFALFSLLLFIEV